MQGKHQISERLYGALLLLYPRGFRATHGRQMQLTFRDACQTAYTRNGVSGLLAVWLPTLFDLFKSALEEQTRQGEITMSKERLMNLSGPLTILIGLLWVLGSIGEFVLLVGLGSPDSFWDVFWFFPVALSFMLMIPTFLGTRLRYQREATGIGTLGLTLNVAGCVGMCSFLLLGFILGTLGIDLEPWANDVIAVCFMTPMIGHILFGIDAVKNKLLPRWNILPILVGLPSVLLIAPSLLIDGTTPHQFQWTLVTTFLRFCLTGAGWVLLGITLMDSEREQQPIAAT